ncbi:MAG: ligase-associated DNA damage response DEXH box helicase [Planctomycetota bacterium]
MDQTTQTCPADASLDRLRAWMRSRGWTPHAFQEEVWRDHLEGRSGLVHVPTGAGKTLAAYFGPLAEMLAEADSGKVVGPRCLYITPLRAVSRDVEKALRRPIEDLGAELTVESRTGDTSSSVRQRQRKRLPNILVTTPESLTLLLTYAHASSLFRGLRSVVLDEWHELLASKRGVQTELALARLRSWSPDLRVRALSATLANLDEAAQAAVGVGARPAITSASIDRRIVIETLVPSGDAHLPWAGHLGLRMLPEVLRSLDLARSTLFFCNTRSQTERWFRAIEVARPEWRDRIGLHHGSIDRAERARLEAGLKDGSVRLVVATSSLDLGVDFAPVERVYHVGSPKGIARLMQRAGRASHRPGEPCHLVCVPTHALELIEISAVRRSIEAGEIEPRLPENSPLDVLSQHLVTCALGGGFDADELFHEVRTAFAYRDLTREQFDWTLRLVSEGGGTLAAYPEYRKVVRDDEGVWGVPSKRHGQLHRLNVGTIVGDSTMEIRFVGGKRLGSIEENFVSGLRRGQKFVFAGRVLQFHRLQEMTCLVRAATGQTNHTPIWSGTRMPISESLSEAVRSTLEAAGGGDRSEPELEAAAVIVETQARLSRVPTRDELLIETCDTREGRHVFVYPFEGRLVHGGLANIIALRLSRLAPATYSVAANDYGFELLTNSDRDVIEDVSSAMFDRAGLLEDTIESVNLGELSKRQFREVARVAGLVFQSYPGAHRSVKQIHATSSLIFDVLAEFDPENLLLHQARREVMERQFEQSRLARTMDRLAGTSIVRVRVDRPTPLGLPLVIERIGGRVSSETIETRVAKAMERWGVGAGR